MAIGNNIKKSAFPAVTSIQTGDYFDFVRNGQNMRISWADLISSIESGISDIVPLGLAINSGVTVTISASGTPVAIDSNWVSQVSNLFTITAAGRFTYTGSTTYVKIDASISSYVVSGADDFSLFIALNGTTVAASKITHRSMGVIANTNVVWAGELANNDYIEFWVQNDDTDANIVIDSAVARLT